MVSLRAWQSSAIAAVCRGAGSGSSRMCKVLVAGSGMMSPEPASAVRIRVWASSSARV